MNGLNPILRKTLEKLAKHNLAPRVADDWDDLCRLNELAEKVTDPSGNDSAEQWLDAPVYLHNIKLHRLSLGAYLWVKHRCHVWFKGRPLYANIGLAYAMVHAHNPTHLKKLNDRGKCRSALRRFMGECGATYAELLGAIDTILNLEPGGGDNEAEQYGPLIAVLCSEYGEEVDYWKWNVSLDTVTALYNQWLAREQAKANAMKGKGHRGMSHVGTAAYERYWKARCAFWDKLAQRASEERKESAA